MAIFTLTADTITLDDGNYNVMVMPNMEIHHFIHAFKFVASGSLTQTVIDNFITEQTPLLFDEFQSMENVPLEIRQNYTL